MNKPPYRVPSMTEIAGNDWNGYNVVSTFSGAGGSCLGYRMAGYRVLWANEFVPAAQAVYKRNHPNSILDTRDIRTVTASDILSAVGLSAGEIDIFDGSPPCSAFSTAGKRNQKWGEINQYSDRNQRVDDLFFEYTRLLKGLQPKVFVAENVSGLVKGVAKGYFLEILQQLKDCGYIVKAKLLDAQWLGVPQARQRLIFIGVRSDLDLAPVFPKPLHYRYSVQEVLPYIKRLKLSGKPDNWRAADRPAATVVQSDGGISSTTAYMSSYMVEADVNISRFAIGDEWDNVKPGKSSDKYYMLQKPSLDKPCPTITAIGDQPGSAAVVHPTEKRKFSIAELKRICAFPDDFELTGTFEQQWERLGRSVPPVMMQHIAAAIRDEVLCKL